MGSFPFNNTGHFPCEIDTTFSKGSGFADGTPLCTWYGIQCDNDKDATTGRVTDLDFSGASPSNPITKSGFQIPDSLGLLQHLETLGLSQLDLAGTLPNSLGSLSKLRIVYLRFNKLTGTVPASMGALPNLASLTLADNKLTGRVPDSWGNLTNLTDLNMEDNEITGFPDSICHLLSGYRDNGKLSNCRMGSNPFKAPCAPCAKGACQVYDGDGCGW